MSETRRQGRPAKQLTDEDRAQSAVNKQNYHKKYYEANRERLLQTNTRRYQRVKAEKEAEYQERVAAGFVLPKVPKIPKIPKVPKVPKVKKTDEQLEPVEIIAQVE